MPVWRKIALFAIVSLAHLFLLIAFNVGAKGYGAQNKSGLLPPPVFQNSMVTLLIATPRSVSNADIPKPADISSEIAPIHPASKSLTAPSEVLVSPPNADDSGWGGRIKFLNADEVDKTAHITDGFEAALEQRLPLNVESIVLEFWIEKDGNTLQVKCLEGACSDAVLASLGKLSELKFSPAVKEDQAVASRKVIQIDIKPRF